MEPAGEWGEIPLEAAAFSLVKDQDSWRSCVLICVCRRAGRVLMDTNPDSC